MSASRRLAALQAVLVVGIVVCIFVIASRHPFTLDLTPDRRFTLTPHTKQVLSQLTSDVDVTVFYSSQDAALRRETADLLALYTTAQPRVHAHLLDLDRSPGAADRLGVSAYNQGVAEAGSRRAKIDVLNEAGFTDAILQVGGLPPVSVWFVVGHGELDPRNTDERRGGDVASRALLAEGFEPHVLDVLADIPADIGFLVLGGPTRDLSILETDALVAWVRGGGALLVLADPRCPPSVDRVLQPFGIELGHDVVVDDRNRMLGADGLAARIAYLNDDVIPNAPDVKAFLPTAQSMRIVKTPGVTADYLAVSGETTWADVGNRVLGTPDAPFRPGEDRRGPLPLGIYARVGPSDGGGAGHIVALGDADFATDLQLGLAGNRDLLLAIAGLLGRGVALAAERPSSQPGGTFSPLVLTAREGSLLLWLGVVVPTLLFAAGAAVTAWRVRRG